ncbi:MAG: hypothetical protein Q9170_008384, partial [Blastenia crenularia]
DIGVLASLPSPPNATSVSANLTRSGLSHLSTPHLSRILEAAFLKCRNQILGKETQPEASLIVTGLEMFEKDDKGQILRHEIGGDRGSMRRGKGERIFWTELPEFSHLSHYLPPLPAGEDRETSVREKIERLLGRAGEGGEEEEELYSLVVSAFSGFLAETLGYSADAFGTQTGMGMDSLNAAGCQYWCHRELGVTITVREIFEAESLEAFVKMICERIVEQGSS